MLGGELTLENTIVSENLVRSTSASYAGGGIYSVGTTTITNSRIIDNSALLLGSLDTPYGAGIATGENSVLTIQQSEISGNSGGGVGGGIAVGGGTNATITNSTISENHATLLAGGIWTHRASSGTTSLTLRNTTISGNTLLSGQLANRARNLHIPPFSSVSVVMRNSIIANAVGGVNCSNVYTSRFNSDANSIIEDGTCNSTARAVDPMIGPLQRNRGFTHSHLPLDLRGSPILNSGSACQVLDQRGATRSAVDSQCDVGSVELSTSSIVVDTIGDNVQQDALGCTLREAVSAVHDDPSGCGVTTDQEPARIVFDESLNGSTITLERNALNFDSGDAIRVDASELENGITIDANNLSQVIELVNTDLSLFNFTITGGRAAIISQGAVNQNGGGIFSSNGSLRLTNCTVTGNSSHLSGGGLYLIGSDAYILGTTISNNQNSFGGAGIASVGSSVTLTNSTISGNEALGSAVGGGVTLDNGSMHLKSTTIANNFAGSGDSSSFWALRGSLAFENSIVADSQSGSECSLSNLTTVMTDAFSIGEDGSCGLPVNLDPKLEALSDNGGASLTHALKESSPAIDSGNDEHCKSTDQRNAPRPFGARCDVGSYESTIEQTIFFTIPIPGKGAVVIPLKP
jgi:hypothetical protein